MKGKLSVQSFERCQSFGSPAMHSGLLTVDHPRVVPAMKVCYSRYYSLFPEIDPAFKLNTDTVLGRAVNDAMGTC